MKLKMLPDRIVSQLVTWPWLFTYLIWQSLVTSSQTSCVTALFVKMVFSDEDKILIKKLYQLKGYNARQLRKEFPDKGWTKSSINGLLKKFRDTDTVGQTSGQRQTAKCPHGWEHLPGERYGSESRVPAPNSQHSPWNITGDRRY